MKQIQEDERLARQAGQDREREILRLQISKQKEEKEAIERLEILKEENRKQEAENRQFLQQNFNVSSPYLELYDGEPPYEKTKSTPKRVSAYEQEKQNEREKEDMERIRKEEEERIRKREEEERIRKREEEERIRMEEVEAQLILRQQEEERAREQKTQNSNTRIPEPYELSPNSDTSSTSKSNSRQNSSSSFPTLEKRNSENKLRESEFSQNIVEENSYAEANWYYGDIQRKDAERLLISCNQNSFMVRNSSVQGCYALSLFSYQKRTMLHLLVQPAKATTGYQIQDSEDNHVYTSLVDILKNSPVVKGYEMCGKIKLRN